MSGNELIEQIQDYLFKYAPKFAQVYATWKTSQQLKNAEELLSKLRSHNLTEFSTSPRGLQLFQRILDQVMAESSEAKRIQLGNLLIASWIDQRPTQAVFDEAVLFTRAVDIFTEAHIVVLDHLDFEIPLDFGELAELVDLEDPRSDLLIVMNDLCGSFCMADRSWTKQRPGEEAKGHLLSTAGLSPEGLARKCLHTITKRGQRFLDWVVGESDTSTL